MNPRRLATLDGYAVEGGYDVAEGIATCYAPTVALGRHAGPGAADNLWRDYETVVDLVGELGLDGVRLTLEWARLAPRAGAFDLDAARRYRGLVEYARVSGLWVTGVLVDAVWPAWAGAEAWLWPWSLGEFRAHAERTLEFFGDVLDGVIGVLDADAVVTRGFIEATAPPWRRRATPDARAVRDNLAELSRTLAASAGEKWVDAYASADVDDFDEAGRLWLARTHEEIHLRSLVRGAGATAARSALVARHHGRWSVNAPEGFLELWG